MEKRLLIICVAIILIASASGAVYHVTPAGAGLKNGADWSNAFAGLPSSLQRGSTYYLADGAYPGYTFNTAESGTQWVIVKKATLGEHGSAVGWQDSFGDGVADFTGDIFLESGYFELNGATGGGPGSWTTGHGIRFQILSGEAISAYKPLSNIRLLHIEVTQPGEIKKMGGISAWKNPFKTDDFYIGYCYFHHMSGLPIFAREGSNWLFEYNYFSDPCGVSLYDQDQHCEHLVSHDADDVTIRYNIMRDGRSTGILVNNDRAADRWKVYGNVFQNEGSSGIISASADSADTAHDWWIFNNVFMGPGDLKIMISSGKAYNNIYLSGPAYPAPGEHDYNYFADSTFQQCNMELSVHENGNNKYPSDCDSLTAPSDPLVSATSDDFRLKVAISGYPGIDICGMVVCDSTNTFNKDWFGNTRGTDGVWDRGALEYGGTGCIPSCAGRQCGDNGCGGSCGTCQSGTCNSGACIQSACSPNWLCTDWSVCNGNIQSRICTDSNSCGTTVGKPVESQTCQPGGLKIGDKIKVVANPSLRVRSSPGLGDATILGEQPLNTIGTIIGSPVNMDGFVWWQIDYGSGVDGWSIEKSGTETYIQAIGSCAHDADTDCDNCVRNIELMNYITKWKSGQATLANLMEAIGKWKNGC